MITSLVLLATLVTSDLKVDREPSTDCFLVEEFKRDLTDSGFKVVTTDRDIAVRYVSTLVNLGVKPPPMDLSTLTGLIIASSPEIPSSILVGLLNDNGQFCYAISVPLDIHNSILRGA